MSFEDFDQQVNDAADKHHPAYREEAWSRMEQLLDTHLPQERKRKRWIFLLLPLLLLLSVGGFFVARNFDGKVISQKAKPVSGDQGSGIGEQGTAASNLQPASNADGGQQAAGGKEMRDEGQETGDKGTVIGDQQPATSNQKPVTSNQKPVTSNQQPATGNQQQSAIRNPQSANQPVTGNQQPASSRSRIKPSPNKPQNPVIKNDGDEEEEINGQSTSALPQTEDKTATVVPAKQEPVTSNLEPATSNQQQSAIRNPQSANPTSNQQPVTSNKKQPATRKPLPATRFSNSFAITLNGGADIAAVRFSEPGQKRLITGIGLEYQFRKNLTLRTGIFQANKVYGAKPGDYNGYLYTPVGYSLSSVNGDCRVYEIPVSIAFTFNPNKKTSFFAAIGATSTIMKKEEYVYNYKSVYGQEYAYKYGVQNKNEHLFSSIDLSAGIQQHLNNRFFFRAEPYLRLPVHGVGLGNIKLKSAGIMLTAGVKPFAKKG